MARREAANTPERTAYVAFVAERLPVSHLKNKNVRKQAQGKTLKYDKCDPTIRAGLDESRRVEWAKWEKFNAGYIVRGDLLRELLDEGHRLIPTQWIETDKAEHKRRAGGEYVAPELKSRLTGCRSERPTC